MLRNLLSAFLFVIFVSGCATPYQSMKHERSFPAGGYASRQIGEDEYEIYFTGNRFTTLERVRKFWHRRAGEICAPRHYTVRFLTVQKDDKARSLRILRGEVLCK